MPAPLVRHAVRLFGGALLVCTVFFPALAWCGEPKVAPTVDAANRVPVSVARDRARLMHSIYSATLDVMHDHYFDKNKAVLPARAMEDVFSEMNRQSDVEARWIAVNTKAMRVQHEPRNDFERAAAAAIASGKQEYEQVENGFYQRAGSIPLGGGCVSCHAGFFMNAPKTPRYAGLVIRVPIDEK